MNTESLRIESTDGLLLQAALDSPAEPKAALALCHPHPKMGGTMNAPLLLALRDELVERAWAVLRFNFRGIGRSQGEPSTGIEEIADARGAIAHLRESFSGLPIAIAGWSFGAAVAVRTAFAERSLVACVAIAPAVKERFGVTAGLPDADSTKLATPTLVVCAARDELVDARDCRSWAEGAGARHHRDARRQPLLLGQVRRPRHNGRRLPRLGPTRLSAGPARESGRAGGVLE